MNYLPMIKALLLGVALIVPTLHGMLEISVTSEDLPVQLRHRGYTPLHIAAYFGRADTIADLIAAAGPEADALVHAKNCSGSTPLHVAAEQGHRGAVEVLIANDRSKASPSDPSLCDIRDTAGLTPVACAAKNGHIDVIRCLIAHGANISLEDKRGNLPFHRATQIGHLEAMEILQPKDEPSNEHNLRVLDRAIPCAIESGKPEALASVKRMIEERRGPGTESGTKWYNYHGATPFLDAAAFWTCLNDAAGPLNTTMLGLTKGIPMVIVHCILLLDMGIQMPLNFFLKETLNWSRSKMVLKSYPGRTALHDAAEGGHLEVIKLLLRYNAEVDAQDAMGRTPLFRAAK